MRYTVNDIKRLTGLDRYRINQYADIVKPVGFSNRGYERSDGGTVDGYKLFDETGLEQFTIISFLTDLGVERRNIRKLFKEKKGMNELFAYAALTAKDKAKQYEDIYLTADFLASFSPLVKQKDFLEIVSVFGLKNIPSFLNNIKINAKTNKYILLSRKLGQNEKTRLESLLKSFSVSIEEGTVDRRTIEEIHQTVFEVTQLNDLKEQNSFLSMIAILLLGDKGFEVEKTVIEYSLMSEIQEAYNLFGNRIDQIGDDESDLLHDDGTGRMMINSESGLMKEFVENIVCALEKVFDFEIMVNLSAEELIIRCIDYYLPRDQEIQEDDIGFFNAFKEAVIHHSANKTI